MDYLKKVELFCQQLHIVLVFNSQANLPWTLFWLLESDNNFCLWGVLEDMSWVRNGAFLHLSFCFFTCQGCSVFFCNGRDDKKVIIVNGFPMLLAVVKVLPREVIHLHLNKSTPLSCCPSLTQPYPSFSVCLSHSLSLPLSLSATITPVHILSPLIPSVSHLFASSVSICMPSVLSLLHSILVQFNWIWTAAPPLHISICIGTVA